MQATQTETPRSLPAAVICLAAGSQQLLVLQKAKALGYRILAVDRNPETPGFAFADERLLLSTHESRPILEALQPLRQHYRIAGLINRSSGIPTITAAEISHALGLPGVPPQAARCFADKALFTTDCARLGLPAPKQKTARDTSDLNFAHVTTPCVVKPAQPQVGKAAVIRVRSQVQLEAAVIEAASRSQNGKATVQSYIEGNDVILLAMAFQQRLYPIGLVDEENVFQAEGYVTASALAIPSRFAGTAVENRIHELAQQLINHYALQTTVLFISFRVTPQHEPYFIEVHLDFGGDQILDSLLPQACDFDYVSAMIQALCGNEPQFPQPGFRPIRLSVG